MTFSFRVVTQHKVYTCALIITALAVTQNVFVMGKKTSYSLKDPIGPRSAYVQELIDSNANIEHILQVMRPERLKDKQQTKQTPISLTSTQGENVETTLEVSATTFSNNDYITIYLKTNGSADTQQWIGAYSPPDVNISEKVPVKVAFPSHVDPDYDSTGVAEVKFQLVNMRGDYVFKFFDCHLQFPTCEVKAQSEVVKVDDPNAPLKPRVLPYVRDDPTKILLMWSSNQGPSSDEQSTDSVNSDPKGAVVEWGTEKGNLENIVKANSSRYTNEDMCGGPAVAEGYRDMGWIHQAVLTDLPPGEEVYYRFGNNAGGGEGGSKMSDIEELRVPPKVGTPGTQLFLYGDMGVGSDDDSEVWREYGSPALNTSLLLEKQILDGWGHGVFHIGDISYATGFSTVWDTWLDMIARVAKRIPYTVNGGNHENDAPYYMFHEGQTPTIFPGNTNWPGGDSGGECGVPMTRLLNTPRMSYNEQWYSWDIGNVHIVAMNTEYDFSRGSPQYKFLEEDLASVDRTVTPWIIFGGHRPLYISSTYKEGNMSDQYVADMLQDHIEPLLVKFKVDIGIWGHNHSGQRFCAVVHDTCKQRSQISKDSGSTYIYDNPEYPIHNVIGTAGADFTFNSENPEPEIVDRGTFYRYGYARVEAANSTHLIWEFVDNGNPFAGITHHPGTVLDRFVIIKDQEISAHHGHSWDTRDMYLGVTGGVLALVGIGIVIYYIRHKRKKVARAQYENVDEEQPYYDPSLREQSHK